MLKRCGLLFVAAVLAGCTDHAGGGETQRLQAQIQELNQQLRQYRAEVQRSNEKIVAMLQAHGLQSDNPRASAPAAAAADPHAGHGAPSASAPRPSSSGTGRGDVTAALHKSHADMDAAMQRVPVTGDPDRDFLAMMIPHHQGAIDMARLVLVHGRDPLTRQLAEEIMASQQAEIGSMQGRLATLERAPPGGAEAFPALTGTRGRASP
jgi:uncharacterized protein (DUF305 family)